MREVQDSPEWRGPQPSVDVVIPFGGGVDLLREQLDAVTAQEHVNPRRVIVSVNVRLDRDMQTRLQGRYDSSTVPVDFVDATGATGPAHARNVGWRASSAEYVLFCDADDRVSGKWVGAMQSALQNAPLAGGRLEYSRLNPRREAAWQRQSIDALPRRWTYLPFTPTSNMGVSREVLSELEGFDEQLLVGEDIDFCWRAQQAGYQLNFAPEAVIHYRLRRSLRAMVRQSFMYGKGDAPLVAKHRALGAHLSSAGYLKELVAVPYFALRALTSREESWMRPAVIASNLAGRMAGILIRRVRAPFVSTSMK